ncbi:MAG: gliding motility-associated C-terminal domain-containing protein [Saprospiraceae bacterium]|nr:gliding motility-associated C-terminal domain-containing protein [Saprospiraceae bacterium]
MNRLIQYFQCIALIFTGVLPLISQEVQYVEATPLSESFYNEEKVFIDHRNISRQLLSQRFEGNKHLVILPFYGKNMEFVAIENEVVDDAFKAETADVRTFDIHSVEDKKMNGTMTISPYGIAALVLDKGKMISIRPDKLTGVQYHIVEYGIKPDLAKYKLYCGHDHSLEEIKKQNLFSPLRNNFQFGELRKTFNLAIVTTGEYYIANGNTNSIVRAKVIMDVNNISAIFKNELSVNLSVGNRITLFSDPATDPFIPGNERTQQAAEAVAAAYPNQNNYTVGHVFHIHADGDGWQNGGVALRGSVCRNTAYGTGLSKGGGWSGAYSNEGNGWISLATHEFGHQFGAQHTFNGIGNSCTEAISDDNAYEIASGTTIMSYQGICQDDNNIVSSGELDNYFHYASLLEMYTYLTDGSGNSCGNNTASNNTIPELLANPCEAPEKTIPRSTPFYLNAEAFDEDGDVLTYTWEQFNEDGPGRTTQGFFGTQAGNSLTAPLFRSFPPSEKSERYFPSIDVLRTVSGTNDFEVLSNRPRTLTFVVTARDNNPVGGAINTDEVNIVVSSSGPLLVDFPKGGEVIAAGSNQMIQWNTNGTNTLCSNVRIKLSFDDGLNFNYIIAENVPYASGSYMFNFPSTLPASASARVMIECMDYDCIKFFNISRATFRITSDCNAAESFVCPVAPLTVDAGSPASNLNMTPINGKIASSLTGNILQTNPAMRVTVNNVNSTSCIALPSVSIPVAQVRFTIEKTGIYNFTRSPGGSGWVTIFRASSFNMSSSCSGGAFVASSGTWAGPDEGSGNSVFPSSFLSVNLTACTEYIMVFMAYNPLPFTVIFQDITGPGFVYEINTNPPATYTTTFVAVDGVSGLVAAHHPTADFSGLPVGFYEIYSVSYKIGGPEPPQNQNPADWIGQNFLNIQSSECLKFSTNFRPLEILSACAINSIEPGAQTSCVVATNSYTQELIITYNQPPATGQLSVNGQLFGITNSPQTIILTGLDANGQPVDVTAFFTDLSTCMLNVEDVFTAPVNCCPITFDLEGSREECVGLPVILNAGNDGQSYVWTKDGTILPNTGTTLNVTESGTYAVTVTHSSGCRKSQAVIISFVNPPVVETPASVEICEGETFTITPTVIGPYTEVKWFRNNIEISGQTGITLDVNQGGSYKVEVINNAGCLDDDVTIVTVLSNPVVNLGNPVINTCQGVPVTLNAGNPTLNHTWYYNGNIISGATSSTYTVPDGQSGTYRCVVSNSADCEGFDEVTVNFFQSPIVEMPSLIAICQGQIATITVTVSDFETIVWKRNNVVFTPTSQLSHMTTMPGTYTVEATNLGNCTTPKSTLVEVNPLPVVELGNNVIACIGNMVNLNAGTDGQTYRWTRNSMVLPETNPQISVNTAGMYSVTVTTSKGCSATDQVTIDFVPGPTVNAGPDITICEGDTKTINATTDATNISWLKNGIPIPNQTSKSLVVNSQGTYTIVVIGGPNNCEARDELMVMVNEKPIINIGADQRICQGDSVTLDAGAGQNYTYRWTRDNTNVGTAKTLIAKVTGLYVVTVTAGQGCSATDQMSLTVVPSPSLVLPTTFDICGTTAEIIMPTTNGTKFQWYRNNVILTGQINKDLSVNMTGTYKIEVSNADDCKIEAEVVVTSRPSPTVNLGIDKILCPEESATLDAGVHDKYLWSSGETTRTITINAGKPATTLVNNYSVTVTNVFDCSATDQVTLTLRQVVKANIISDEPGVCSGNPVTLTATGGDVFVWTDPNGSLSATNSDVVIASPTVTTTYKVEVSDSACPDNIDTDSIRVTVFTPVNVSAGNDTSMIIGRTIELNAKGGKSYLWNNQELIIGSNTVANPEISISENTTFVVTITDINGCKYIDSVLVTLIEDPLNSFLAVSIITPNGDGDNDVLEFIGLESFPDNSLRIYNRWGNVVFEGFRYQSEGELFDGTRNGERLPPDTYYYVLTFEGKVYKSALTIIWN